jgi:peroxiredoxin
VSTLKAELALVTQQLGASLPQQTLSLLQRSIQRMVNNGIGSAALGEGRFFPRFSLPNATADAISSEDLVAQGPLVVCFYRGGWCPYCTLELRAYQEVLPEIRALGADFIAISPQLPDEALAMAAKANLGFEVLSDTGNSMAEHLGLMVELSPAVADVYRSLGHDLERINGNSRWTLPIPATYIIDADHRVQLAFVNPDYAVRLEPSRVLEMLTSMCPDAADTPPAPA